MTSLDVLRATFPAGTLTGAPKIRAMEIIDELEPVKRGIYGGACGYLSFAGDMDVAIAIRTGIVQGQHAVRAGRRRHRGRFGARAGMAGNRSQGARADRAPPNWSRRASEDADAADDRQLRLASPTTWCSTSASWARTCACFATTRSRSTGIAALKPERLVLSPGPVHADRGRHLRRGDPALRRQAADPRRVPRPPGIGAAFGGKIVRAQRLMHGKASVDQHRRAAASSAACRSSSA